jgi:membrane fusion protein, multidrug efflux system
MTRPGASRGVAHLTAKEGPMRHLLWLPLLTVAISVPSAAQQPAPSAVPVTTFLAEARPVSETRGYVGRIEAVERVDIRARVTGYLEAVLFKEGDAVQVGQPLYRIEQDLFKAAVSQAEGALDGSKASKKLAQVELDRANQLMASTFGTPQKRDQALAADENAAATILTAQANLETAKINLGYTDIKSPIAGKISRTKITKGNVVSPDSGVLTTVVSQNPMYVVFPVSQREFLDVQRGDKVDASGAELTVAFSNGSVYGHKGRIDFVDVTVEKSTDTITVRARIPNPDDVLVDGQLVQVKVGASKPQEKVVIPQSALLADQQGTYVYVVENGKAAIRRLTVGTEVGVNIAIESGLKAGEQIVVEGLQRIRPGTPVLTSPMLPQARS